jgi:hypothetical protein
MRRCLVGTTAILAAGSAAFGTDLVIDVENDLRLDVEYFVGSGDNVSYLIVDFGFTGGDSYAFGYLWNDGDDARGFTMLEAVASEMNGLMLDFIGMDGVGFGVLIDNFEYPPFAEVGDPANFWAYYNAEAADVGGGTIDWAFASAGASARSLQDGSIDGWYNGFDGTLPEVPAIPAPATTLAFAALLLGGRRRRE